LQQEAETARALASHRSHQGTVYFLPELMLHHLLPVDGLAAGPFWTCHPWIARITLFCASSKTFDLLLLL
jgi:hypothetical protein